MYSHCIFCHADLGANDAVEHFPVGRRLAFDPAMGRLWAICTQCARWNLTPLEERWEAIEECERLFRETRLRVSTDHIGLARVREGTELVRVGEPQRPEMAAWRYGEQFGRRRRRYHLLMGGGVLAAAGLQFGALGVGAGFMGGSWVWQLVRGGYERLTAVRVPGSQGGATLRITQTMAQKSRFYVEPGTGQVMLSIKRGSALHRYEGESALRIAAQMFPKVNASGASKPQVAGALDAMQQAVARGSGDLVRALLQQKPFFRAQPLKDARPELLLALEMSLHEDTERAALEGELAQLEDRWREAEEIAAISDDLFMPEAVLRALGALKGGK